MDTLKANLVMESVIYSHLYRIVAEELETDDSTLAVAFIEFQEKCGGTLPHLLELLAEVRQLTPHTPRQAKAFILRLLVRTTKRSGNVMIDLLTPFQVIISHSKNGAEDMEIWHELYDEEVLNGIS